MRDAGVHIGAHTAGHLHLPAHTIAGVQQDLVRARERLEAELGSVPTIFAYPFGEASAAVRDLIAGEGFEAAFGQHSGVTHNSFDRFFLPRFPLSEEFGDLERLRLVASALPIPIADLTPRDPQIQENPPLFGFTLTGDLAQRDGLACFATGQGQVELEWLGPRAEVRMPEPFSPGRARINCTAPAGEGRWRWLGMQYYVPR